MSVFSEMLKRYLLRSQVPVSKLAAETGVDRTLLHKYLSGTRNPRNYAEVDKIGSAVMLTVQEQKSFLEAYWKAVYGDKNYENLRSIADFLEGRYVDTQGKMDFFRKEDASAEQLMCEGAYYGKFQVEGTLGRLIACASRRKAGRGFVGMLVQPDSGLLLKNLWAAYSSENTEVEQIICLEGSRTDNDNVSILGRVLAFEAGSLRYRCRFYYDHVESHINRMSLLPNLIVTEDAVLLADFGMDECLVLTDREEVSFYQRQYERFRHGSQPLTMIEDASGSLREEHPCGTMISIASTPHFTVKLAEEMYESAVGKLEAGAGELSAVKAAVSEWTARESVVCDYFTEEGLRTYLRTGRLADGVSSSFSDEKMRREALKVLAQALKENLAQGYLAVRGALVISDFCSIHVKTAGEVEFQSIIGGKRKSMRIRESSVCESIALFRKYVEENDLVLNQKATIQKIEKLLEEDV